MADRIGQQLGNYRLIRLLGRGGFAEVYLGEHIRLGTQAAIKILYTNLSDEDATGFLTEARTIANLEHSHIVRVLDFDVQEGIAFLVMSYAPNGTLRQRHPKGSQLPLNTIVEYVKQIADALQYAHDEKLIHRDIKPENMLLGRRDEILLSDFGVALIAQSSRLQSTQDVIGTAQYMAPEQLQGKPRFASDQYSLGVVVYEWLCGERPFHGSFTELYSQHLFVPPPSLREKMLTISSEVEQVVLTALAKDPKERFGNVKVFATALEQACQIAPSHAAALTSQPPMSDQPLPPTDTVAAIPPTQLAQPTDVVTLSSQSLQPTNIVTPPSESSQLLVDTVPPASAPAVLPPSIGEAVPSDKPQMSRRTQPRISRRAVIAGLTGVAIAGGGLTWLALSQKSKIYSSLSPTTTPTATTSPTPSPTPTPIPRPLGTTFYTYHGHTDIVEAVAWSPDGTRIASVNNGGFVKVWDAVDGNHVQTYQGHPDYMSVVAWSPDSTRIAYGAGDSTVQVWNAVNNSHIYTYQGHSSECIP